TSETPNGSTQGATPPTGRHAGNDRSPRPSGNRRRPATSANDSRPDAERADGDRRAPSTPADGGSGNGHYATGDRPTTGGTPTAAPPRDVDSADQGQWARTPGNERTDNARPGTTAPSQHSDRGTEVHDEPAIAASSSDAPE